MKRFSVSCALYVLPVATLLTGLHLADAAQAAQSQTERSILPIETQPVADTVVSKTGEEAEAPTPDQRQIDCMAKVIVHEAGNQVQRGQIAVAQVIRARMKRSGAEGDACQIVRQRGQFFDVDSYAPSRESPRWRNAVAIATDTLMGKGDEIVPGALFFHAATHPMRGRVQVAQIDDHIFYR